MKRLSRSLAPSYLPAVIAAFVVLVAGILADNQNQVVAEARLRARVAEELNPIRAKLEANVNGNPVARGDRLPRGTPVDLVLF